MTDKPYPEPPRPTLDDLDPESATTDRLIAMVRSHRKGEEYPAADVLLGNLPKVLRAVGLLKSWGAPSKFPTIHAFVFFGVHVSAKDGVDPGLVAAGLFKPLQQISIQPHGDELLGFWKNQLGLFPKIFLL